MYFLLYFDVWFVNKLIIFNEPVELVTNHTKRLICESDWFICSRFGLKYRLIQWAGQNLLLKNKQWREKLINVEF